jgi:hypothetical protein
MTAQPNHLTPVPTVGNVTDDVHRLLTLKDARQTIDHEIASIKARLADTIGTGQTVEVGDVTVTVRPPNRRFNADRAVTLLDDETRDRCLALDAKLVKRHLTALQLDECMDDGTGDPIVDVK